MANYAQILQHVHELATQINNFGNHQPRRHRDHLANYDDMMPTHDEFQAIYRLTPAEFEQLCLMLDPQIGRANESRKILPTNLRVLMFLHFVAHGDSYTTLARYYKCANSTVCNVVKEVNFIYCLYNKLM